MKRRYARRNCKAVIVIVAVYAEEIKSKELVNCSPKLDPDMEAESNVEHKSAKKKPWPLGNLTGLCSIQQPLWKENDFWQIIY